MWERLQYDQRFLFLPKDKVVHEVVDNLGDGPKVAKNGRGEDWWYEDKQTSAGVQRARTWADTVEVRIGPDDLFISADTDEVMSRIALHKLRWCELASKGPISGALWMPVGNLNRAYRSDFAASGRPHSFALPSIYRWEDIANGKREGKRLQANYPGPRDRYADRYPYWFGKPDPRNVQLVAAMHSGAKRDEKPLVSNYEFVWR